jgi:UPF0755 protein
MLKKIKKRVKKPVSTRGWIFALVVLLAISVGGVWTLRSWYNRNLLPVSSSLSQVYFTVSPGDTRSQIAKGLEEANLIRNAKAFENYVRSHEIENLQAGTYTLSPSMDVPEIVKKISTGDVTKNLLTILPAKRLDQIKKTFLNAGYTEVQVESAFDPEQYADMAVLSSLPAGASLEGYLYPDSFQKQSDTPAEAIIRGSLQETQKYLTSDVVNGLGAQGLSVYQGMILASIVEQETSDPADQPMVAQVFLSRYKQGIMLGSDVTAFYASALAGLEPTIFIESPYNTRVHSGLPPGPIGNFTASALRAVAKPANTSYLYFVAGDDGVLHFTNTAAEHEAAIDQYCHKACGR